MKRNGMEIGGELISFLSEGEIEEMKAERESNAMDQEEPKKEVFPYYYQSKLTYVRQYLYLSISFLIILKFFQFLIS